MSKEGAGVPIALEGRRDSASGKMHRKRGKSVGEKVIISEACTFLEDA